MIGVALPILPTTPFMLLAVFAFGKSSPRLAHWLQEHATFGPPIKDWQAYGAIRPRHKRMAISMMGAVFALSIFMALPVHVLAIQGVCLAGAGSFILTRPNGPRADVAAGGPENT